MLFSSTIFLFAYLPLVLLGYYLINVKYRNVFLLIASIFFYAWGEPKFVVIMVLSIIVNYLFALIVDRYRNQKIIYFIMGLMVLINVSIFFIFKYLNFTIRNLNILFDNMFTQTNILLPIGISFFTFQAMSYVIDVYRQKGKVQKNPINVGLYISFFPQLIAGPIVRYETISNAINNRKETIDDFVDGIKRFIIGLSKKIIISNSVALLADKAFGITDYSQLSASMAWLGALAFSLQIFYDFSGYSDMAIGLGKMFGFHFDENFNYPYISKTISEFWRRWHISLGTWFRDYVYFPLGGSKVQSKKRLIFNLLVVWSLTGIWHGASWNFILWGLFYFVFIAIEKLFDIPKKVNKKIISQLYRIFTLLCILLGWVLFKAKDLHSAIGYMKSMFGLSNNSLYDVETGFQIQQYLIILVIAIIFCTPFVKKIKLLCNTYVLANKIAWFITPIMYIVLFIISIAYTITSTYNPFIYFNF